MKKFIITTFVLTVLLGIAYIAAWDYMAKNVREQIGVFYSDTAAQNGIVLYGDMPVLSGFPFVPKITYGGGLFHKGVKYEFSDLEIKGFPIPHMPITIKFSDDLLIGLPGERRKILVEKAEATIIAPEKLPKSGFTEDKREWRKDVEHVEIESLHLKIAGSKIKSEGTFGLDELLQPVFTLDSKIYDYDEFLKLLIFAAKMPALQAALALSALNGMAQTDEDGKKFVDINTRIENMQLYIGPFRILEVPFYGLQNKPD